jgi:hypothetical protein
LENLAFRLQFINKGKCKKDFGMGRNNLVDQVNIKQIKFFDSILLQISGEC